ncbi:MAG: hypothetical protein QGH41_07535, partial [Roseibacillus sp.]|nr:hypothetical protein [Roseibacillus sp.]
GQVSVLSSKFLKPEKAVVLLRALRSSSLYREDQQSYILYPNRRLPHFVEKNHDPEVGEFLEPAQGLLPAKLCLQHQTPSRGRNQSSLPWDSELVPVGCLKPANGSELDQFHGPR